MKHLKHLKNKSGNLVLDFVFAITLVLGVSTVIFLLSFSLSIVEVVQYIAFASSRNYFASDFSEETQAARAEKKFELLINDPVVKNLFGPQSWFQVKYLGSKDYREEYQDGEDSGQPTYFVGSKIEFTASVLDFEVPFYGSTTPDGGGYKTNINSFLGREPSAQECENFGDARWENIIQLDAKYAGAASDAEITNFNDNGC